MLNQSDTLDYKRAGFDGDEYIRLQRESIEDRMACFDGKLYLEIGGKFLYDAHASRVLPGFYPDTKKRIFSSLMDDACVVFCINAKDVVAHRQLSNEAISYEDSCFSLLKNIEQELGVKASVVVNRMAFGAVNSSVKSFIKQLESERYRVCQRYDIDCYPDVSKVLCSDGYGRDDYLETDKNLILVTGAASSSGKMSTCLGQLYLDRQHGLDSGYAKYETFPIWNLDLDHPVNLAYEAATADIADYNCIDTFHLKAYKERSVNYNRDVQAFPLLMGLAKNIVGTDNFIRHYLSPTDMGISNAGFCISDEFVVRDACLAEIERRKGWYKEIIARGKGDQQWVDACDDLLKKFL